MSNWLLRRFSCRRRAVRGLDTSSSHVGDGARIDPDRRNAGAKFAPMCEFCRQLTPCRRRGEQWRQFPTGVCRPEDCLNLLSIPTRTAGHHATVAGGSKEMLAALMPDAEPCLPSASGRYAPTEQASWARLRRARYKSFPNNGVIEHGKCSLHLKQSDPLSLFGT